MRCGPDTNPTAVSRLGTCITVVLSAKNSEILIDRIAASAVASSVALVEPDPRTLKGFDQPVPVFSVVFRQ